LPAALGPVYVGWVNSHWQTVTALLIVALGATGLLWAKFRRRKFNFHRDTHCGCAPPRPVHDPSIHYFPRPQRRAPQVIVKKK
jgi:hypothetical protein